MKSIIFSSLYSSEITLPGILFSIPLMVSDLRLEFYSHIPANISLKQTGLGLSSWRWPDMILKLQFLFGKECQDRVELISPHFNHTGKSAYN